jgi:hypothetical protein
VSKPPKKQRLSVYLDPDVMKALAAHAARRDLSLSLVAEAGIASFLSPDAAERQEAATTKRLDQLDRRMARMERDLGISVETLAVFIGACECGGALRSLRDRARPSTRDRTEAQTGDFGRHPARARRGIIIDARAASIRAFRRSPVFVRHSTTAMRRLLSGHDFCLFYSSPIQGRTSRTRKRTGTTWRQLTRNRKRFFAVRECCAQPSGLRSPRFWKIPRSSR